MEELLLTVLSQNTNWQNTSRAYKRLKDEFKNLKNLEKASIRKLENILKPAGLYRRKAQRIKEILKIVKREEGKLSLRRLRKLSAQAAWEYLLRLPGIGMKTAKCVLLFSLNRKFLPGDTHIFRVSKRLGIVPQRAKILEVDELLSKLMPEKQYLNFHIKMILHGREFSRANNPKCEICFLSNLWSFYLERS